MPLRDHFRPPVSRRRSWEEIHGMWPARLVMQLKKALPPGYESGPIVHLGAQAEVEIVAYDQDEFATGSLAAPTLAVETEIPDDDEYEVRIYDAERERTLVAVIELVSPANKDRPDKRNRFVAKCSALLCRGIAVSIVDVVTTRQSNLYAELLTSLGHSDPTWNGEPPAIYAASCRWLIGERRGRLETWSHTLEVGKPLPTLPLWLSPVRYVPLDLEPSYEAACDDLNIA